MMLRAKNQLSRLHGSALTVPGVWGGFSTHYHVTSNIDEAEVGCDHFPIGSKISLCNTGVMIFSCIVWLGLCSSQTLNSLSKVHQHKCPTIPNSQFSGKMEDGKDDLKVYVNFCNIFYSKITL